jgi:hypothetical protein
MRLPLSGRRCVVCLVRGGIYVEAQFHRPELPGYVMLYPPGRAAAPDTAGMPERPGDDLLARERTAIFGPPRVRGWAWS